MLRRFYTVLLLITVITVFFNIGCSSEHNNKNEIAYISANTNSEYENTFKELNLGILFDFNFKLLNADKSWVDIWVEGYSNGKIIEPFPLTSLSYGLSPDQVEEGKIGFGIINSSNRKEPQYFLYAPSVGSPPHTIDTNFLIEEGISKGDYAISSKTIGLEYGEEKVLAVYRQGKKSLRTGYDYQNLDSIYKMIQKDTTVLLLKIKVQRENEL